MRARRFLAVLAVPAALLLGGCGNETDPASASDDPTSSESVPGATSDDPSPSEDTATASESADSDPSADWPVCQEVWVGGQELPAGYAGCVDSETGEGVAANGRHCEFGRPLVTFADRFWAVPKGTIHEASGPLEQDTGYQSALKSCTA